MEEKNTNEIEEMLQQMKPGQLSSFYKENRNSMADDKKGFYYYIKEIIETKNIRLKDIYSFAGLSESYGEKIIRMEKHTKNRDIIIRICIAAHFSLEETNKALKLYGMNTLYAKDARDACLIVLLHNRVYDMFEIDDNLIKHGFKQLSVE